MKLYNGHCLPSRVDRMIDKMPFHHKITVYFSTFCLLAFFVMEVFL